MLFIAAVTCGGLAELGGWALAPESGQRRPDPVRSTGLFAQRLRGAGKSVEQQVTAAFPRRASVAGTGDRRSLYNIFCFIMGEKT